jgi:hypothetical protein
MKTIFRGIPLEAARCAAVTAVRALREIPTGHKG